MDAKEIERSIIAYVMTAEKNRVPAEDAIHERIAGMRIYDEPIVGFASASDALFTEEYKKESVISEEHKAPCEWLPGAKTVISIFLPFSEAVKISNREKTDVPYEEDIPQRCSAEWLHARIEGQALINELTAYVEELLSKNGYRAVCPAASEGFKQLGPYKSNWSERHAAYAAGLGTFGLSRGLITKKGIAGRFGSVITDAEFPPTVREYDSPFEYCIMCGACMRRCPAGAIDIKKGCASGKDQTVCGPYVMGSFLPPHGEKGIVRYGCGKCQTGVPCESGIPRRK